jgi:hypothetical protein
VSPEEELSMPAGKMELPGIWGLSSRRGGLEKNDWLNVGCEGGSPAEFVEGFSGSDLTA